MIKKIWMCALFFGLLLIAPAVYAAAPEAARLVPAYMELPTPSGFLKIVMLLTFYLHLLLVDIVLGSVILAVIDHRTSASYGKDGVAFMPKILALAVNLGIAPFLFLQVVYGSYLYPSLVLMAVWWLSIVFLVMLAYYGLYVSDSTTKPARRIPVLALTAMMLLATAFLLTNMSTLVNRPDRWLLWFASPNGTLLNIGDQTLFPRYLHIVMATLAVGGLTMAWRAHWSKSRPNTDPFEADKRLRRGLDWFFYITLAQLGAGPLFLFSQPAHVRGLFLGGSALHTSAIVLVLAGLSIALYLARKGNLKFTTFAAMGIILVMVSVRGLLRDAMLRPYLEDADMPSQALAMPHGQMGAIVLFLGCLVISVIFIIWLARVLLGVYGQQKNGSGTQEG